MIRKKHIFIIFVSMIFWSTCFGGEKIQLNESIDLGKKMVSNNIFLNWCDHFDADDEALYFLDKNFSMVFKVDGETGKLIKTISSPGQGSFELQSCDYLRVQNKKVFILDRMFGGIKIFDTDGKGIKELKLSIPMNFLTMDVNEKDEIFFGFIDKKNNSMVSVYDINGKMIKSLIPLKNKAITPLDKYYYYVVKLDKTGNIYLLHYMSRELEKYDPSGKLLWQKSLTNDALKRIENDETISEPAKGSLSVSNRHIFELEITPKNNIIIGHNGGGCLLSPNGDLKALFIMQKKFEDISTPRIQKNYLINLNNMGSYVFKYPFKED